MAIDQSIINFAVYEDSIEYAGMAKVTLPDVTFLTLSISGAGIGGNIDAVILGHLEAMTLGLEFRTTTAQSIKLSEIRRHQIDLRVPVQYEDPINGTIDARSEKHVLVVIPKSTKSGTIAPATPANILRTRQAGNKKPLQNTCKGLETRLLLHFLHAERTPPSEAPNG